VLGDELHDVAVDHHLRQVHAVVAERAAEHVADHRLGGEAEAHQDAPEVLAGAALLGERDAHLVLAHHALADEQLADAPVLDR